MHAEFDRDSISIKLLMMEVDMSTVPPDSSKNEDNGRMLFVGNLPKNFYSDAVLADHFRKFGPVESASIVLDGSRARSRCFAFVTFKQKESAKKAAESELIIHDLKADIKPWQARPAPKFARSSTELIVHGARPAYHNAENLRAYFERFGTVTKVDIDSNRKGCARVVFAPPTDGALCTELEFQDAVRNCLALGDSHYINGHRVTVSRYRVSNRNKKEEKLRERMQQLRLTASMEPDGARAVGGSSRQVIGLEYGDFIESCLAAQLDDYDDLEAYRYDDYDDDI